MEMEKEELRRKIIEAIDDRAEEIIGIGQDIFAHPELGYKEFRTSDIVANALQKLGLSVTRGLGITGVAARLKGKAGRPNVCVMGELDAVVCPGHPHADKISGAAHACGHNGQVASMIGAAMGLVLGGAAEFLSGQVTFLGVPAEEFVELEYRQKLREEGKIEFFGGKQELLAKGFFDDVDMAMMIHMGSLGEHNKVNLGGTSNGFIGKLVKYKGLEAHAGRRAAGHQRLERGSSGTNGDTRPKGDLQRRRSPRGVHPPSQRAATWLTSSRRMCAWKHM